MATVEAKVEVFEEEERDEEHMASGDRSAADIEEGKEPCCSKE